MSAINPVTFNPCPTHPVTRNLFRSVFGILLVGLLWSAPMQAQPAQLVYSIDFQGPTAGAGTSPADILLPGPGVFVPGTAFGLVPAPSTGKVEMDAISKCSKTMWPGVIDLVFTVDEFAAGINGLPSSPDVASEGLSGNQQASADVFFYLQTGGSVGLFDGDGMAPFPGPGLGLIEPNPGVFGLADAGDTVDGLFYENRFHQRIYFSLDASWMDPLEGFPVNSGTAAANGVAPGDILVYVPGATPPTSVYATYQQLGLGPDDDVDALIVHDSGNGLFDPSVWPWDWICSGQTDMLLFSVRRGSPIIGTLDTLKGLPIEEGDVLTVMNGGATPPGIFVPAESLGLRTVRAGYTLPSGFADDLNGMARPVDRNQQDHSCDPMP